MKILVFAASIVVGTISQLHAQEVSDYDPYTRANKTWFSGELRYNTKNYSFRLAQNARFEGNMRVQQIFTQARIKREFTNWLDLAGSWRRFQIGNDVNRFDADILLRERFKPFTFKNRIRYTYASGNGQMYIREKLEMEIYKKKKYISKKGKEKAKKPDLIPSISAELFYNIDEVKAIDKYRISAALSYEMNEKLDLSVVGRYQQDLNVNNPEKAFILSTNLSLSL